MIIFINHTLMLKMEKIYQRKRKLSEGGSNVGTFKGSLCSTNFNQFFVGQYH